MKFSPTLFFLIIGTVVSFVKATDSNDFCDNASVGNGLCKDPNLCCSKWGWCGSTSTHCDPLTCVSGPSCPNGGTPTAPPVAGNSTMAPTPIPTAPPSRPPTNAPTTPPSQPPTNVPTAPPTNNPTSHSTDDNDTPCGNGIVGNGLCQNPCQCCSGWGWCSFEAAHCSEDTCFSNPSNTCTRPDAVTQISCSSVVGTSSPTKKPTSPPTNLPTTPEGNTLAPTDTSGNIFDTPAPTKSPSKAPTPNPTSVPATPNPTNVPTPNPTSAPVPPTTPTTGVAAQVEAILESKKNGIDNQILLYQNPSLKWEPSSVYRYEGLMAGLRVMHQDGVNGHFFYMGDDSNNGHVYGLVNIAAFLAQSMKETIQYDACDENSWDLVNGVYPLSNACGQLSQSYENYHCTPEEAYMECPVDPNMSITATTNAKWYGAPGPLKCGPKSEIHISGYWDYSAECNLPWNDPPSYCTAYEGQKAGKEINDYPVANRNGVDSVEGCCWWGRGVIQTTGVCNFGKLNYFLGKRAADEGRASPYPTIDFCQDPGAICASEEFEELKWIAGMFYWMESLQRYNEGGWNYITELHNFVDGGLVDDGFIHAVSGIVNRGCHNPPCASGAVDGGPERRDNFHKVLSEFGVISRRKKSLRL